MNKNIKRKMSLGLTLLLALALLVTGCSMPGGSKSGGSGGGGAKVMYVSPTPDDFKILLSNALADSAAEAGVTLELGEPCATVDEQVAQIERAVNEGFDAIICLPVDRATCLQLEVSAGDLPIIFVNSMPDKEYLEKDKYMCVGSYEMDAGRYQAEYVWNKLGNPSTLNLVILRGELTHNASIQRSVSVKDYFKENGVAVNYVFDDTANWDTTEAGDVFSLFLKTNQPYDAVICNNDSMALGVCDVMRSRGIDMSKIPVCGVDATVDGCKSIVDGEMQFTVYQSATGQGAAAIDTVKRLVNNGTAEGVEGLAEDGIYVWVPFEKVDASNVKNYMK